MCVDGFAVVHLFKSCCLHNASCGGVADGNTRVGHKKGKQKIGCEGVEGRRRKSGSGHEVVFGVKMGPVGGETKVDHRWP